MNESRDMKMKHRPRISQWKSRLMQWRLSQMVYVNNARSESCRYGRLLSGPEVMTMISRQREVCKQHPGKLEWGQCLPGVTREQPIKIRRDLGPHDDAAAGYHWQCRDLIRMGAHVLPTKIFMAREESPELNMIIAVPQLPRILLELTLSW